ncbi:MAG: alpha/beta fold hydrolase [Myxococcota bacterium]|nr:alpha/beta fold hydrolase [Myxococcota bacterium]
MTLAVGVHRLHDDVSLDFQLNRLATLGGGRLDEIREAATRIRDLDDWKREFLALAERASGEGRAQQVAAYLRAAEFMMAPGDPDKAAAYERQAKLFAEIHAADLDGGRLHLEDVPYPGGVLPSWRITPPAGTGSRGRIVLHGGFDSYGEELYPLARAFGDAGYETVLFEGPGQGSVIRRQGIPFTTEWEKPVGAVLDHFGIDDATLVGMSLGGFLAPRAAAWEPRVRRVVAWGVMWDFFEAALSSRPPALRQVMRLLLSLGADAAIDRLVARQMRRDPLMRWAVEHGTYTLGVGTPAAFFRAMKGFTTRGFSSRIRQDFLLLAGAEDHYIPLAHFHRQAAALTHVRSFTGRIFTAAESAQTHCQVGNRALAVRVILDWIAERSASR